MALNHLNVFESPSYRLLQSARTTRSFTLSEIIIAAFNTTRVVAQWAYKSSRERRKAAGIRDALRGLDDRTLRDIGVDRSEIASVAAELTGQAERSRVHTWQAVQELPAAWTAPEIRLVDPVDRADAGDRSGTSPASRRDVVDDAIEARRRVLLALELETIAAGAGSSRPRAAVRSR